MERRYPKRANKKTTRQVQVLIPKRDLKGKRAPNQRQKPVTEVVGGSGELQVKVDEDGKYLDLEEKIDWSHIPGKQVQGANTLLASLAHMNSPQAVSKGKLEMGNGIHWQFGYSEAKAMSRVRCNPLSLTSKCSL